MGETTRNYLKTEREENGYNQEEKIHTYPRITWDEFLKIAEECGLKCAFKGTFEGRSKKNAGTITHEKEVILFDQETGIVVFAETADEKFLRDVTINCEISGSFSKLDFDQSKFFLRVAMIKQGVKGIGFTIHSKRGFKENISTLKKLFKFVPVWDTDVIPNCLNYMERGRNIEGRNEQKIKACLPELKKIIHC